MTDLNATRIIKSITTIHQTFFVDVGIDCFDTITTVEKQGNGEFVMVIWYQCWKNGARTRAGRRARRADYPT